MYGNLIITMKTTVTRKVTIFSKCGLQESEAAELARGFIKANFHHSRHKFISAFWVPDANEIYI